MSKPMTEQQLREHVKRQIGRSKQREYARAFGVSDAVLSRFLNGRDGPGPMLLAGLGMEQVVLYRSKA